MADQSTIDQVLDFVKNNDVKFIRLAFCDIFGRQKNISVQPGELREAFTTGINFDAFLIPGYDDPVYQDLFLLPDPSTLSVLPWRPQEGRVIRFYCDVVLADGTPFPYDSRQFLRDTIAECHKENFSVRVGLKSEFYLFRNDENGNPINIPWDNGGYFDIAPADRGENIRRDICLTLEEMGIKPESSHHESGPGQNEIDFASADAQSTADNFITYKNVVSAIASRNGVRASFEPRPLPGESGNGLHMKIALYRKSENLFDTEPDTVEHFMAGILNRIREITAFLNSSIDSYDRLGAKEAPKFITWSRQNRSRLMRIASVRGRDRYFILRSPDSGINPYLAQAMVIRAGLEGVRGKEKLPVPRDIPSRRIPQEELKKYHYISLPESLKDAIQYARASKFLHQEEKTAAITERYLDVLEATELDQN